MHLNKLIIILTIQEKSLFVLILILMTISFPIGLYLILNYDSSNTVIFTHELEFSLNLPIFGSKIIKTNLGYSFVSLWCILLALFVIAFLNSKNKMFDFKNTDPNMLHSVIQWFVILVVLSGIINFVQEQIGMQQNYPNFNTLINFFDVTKASIVEELGFRVVLIGMTIYLLYSRKIIGYSFLQILYCPSNITNKIKKTHYGSLIITSGIFFGLLHVLFGELWGADKLVQATISGIILGWAYFKHGIIVSILIHWSINYFVFTYIFLISYMTKQKIAEAIFHPAVGFLETIFIIIGIVSMITLITRYVNKKL